MENRKYWLNPLGHKVPDHLVTATNGPEDMVQQMLGELADNITKMIAARLAAPVQ